MERASIATTFFLAGALLLAHGAVARDCGGTVNIYGRVSISSLVPGTVEVGWQVMEDPSIDEYRVSRYDCARPRHCSVPVATVAPSGPSPSGESRTYTLTDIAPPGLWIYRLTVLRRSMPSCIEEVAVLVPPPGCDLATLCAQLEATLEARETDAGVQLSWATYAEGAIAGYRVVRLDRNDPAKSLGFVAATGDCGAVVDRRLTATPTGDWGYRLEALDHARAVACRVEVLVD